MSSVYGEIVLNLDVLWLIINITFIIFIDLFLLDGQLFETKKQFKYF